MIPAIIITTHDGISLIYGPPDAHDKCQGCYFHDLADDICKMVDDPTFTRDETHLCVLSDRERPGTLSHPNAGDGIWRLLTP